MNSPALVGPERLFLGWTAPALPAAARIIAGHYAAADEIPMDRATLVLPGGRAGRRLKELLLGEAEKRGLRLLPPRVTTVGALPELLYEPPRPPASRAATRHIWIRALRAFGPDRLAPVFGAVPEPADRCGWMRVARTVEGLHREVGGAGLRFADVIGYCTDGLLFADVERWGVLAETQRIYEAELARLGWSDSHLGRIDAVASGAIRTDRDLWLIGIVEMPRVLHLLLSALPPSTAPVRALIHAPVEEAAYFDPFGALCADLWSARPVPLADEQIAVCGRPADQAAEVARALGALNGRYTAEEIVVAVPDPEMVPYLEQHLGAAGAAVRPAGGLPVERSAVVRLLAAFADYLDDGRFAACASLARHPDLWWWLRRIAPDDPAAAALREPAAWLEPLDAYFSDALPLRLGADAFAGEGRHADAVGAFCRALDDPRLLRRMQGRRRLAEWMPEVMGLLTEVYGAEPLRRSNPDERRLIEASASVSAAARELFQLHPDLDDTCTSPTAIRLLIDEMQGGVLAPEAAENAIDLLGWLELPLDDAPVVIVTGFNEPFLPESVNAHPFLPNALRAKLGLVDNTRRLARDVYALTALLHSREQVRVIAGRRTAAGDPLRPSRLMLAVEGRPLAERVLRFYADGNEGAIPATPPAQETRRVGRFTLPPEPVLRAPEPATHLTVTAFKPLLSDPYLYALERILKLSPLDDRSREMDGLRFGSLAHAVLERFGRSDAAGTADEMRVRAALDDTLDQVAAVRFGAQGLPALRIQVEQLRARLHAFAAWQANWISKGWQVAGVECRTPPGGGVAFEVDGEPIYLTGRIDRIDYNAELRAWAVFDYKTGAKPQEPEETHRAGKAADRRWIDLQLPLYRHLLSGVEGADGQLPFPPTAPADVRLGYLLLPNDLGEVGARFADWGDEDLHTADACARDVVRLLRRNKFTFDPACRSANRGSALAPVLGIGYLESAAAAQEEDA